MRAKENVDSRRKIHQLLAKETCIVITKLPVLEGDFKEIQLQICVVVHKHGLHVLKCSVFFAVRKSFGRSVFPRSLHQQVGHQQILNSAEQGHRSKDFEA